MEKLELYQYVAFSRDVPEYNLKQDDVAMLIDYVTHPSGGENGYILEVFNAVGDSLAVLTVPMSKGKPKIKPNMVWTLKLPSMRFSIFTA